MEKKENLRDIFRHTLINSLWTDASHVEESKSGKLVNDTNFHVRSKGKQKRLPNIEKSVIKSRFYINFMQKYKLGAEVYQQTVH